MWGLLRPNDENAVFKKLILCSFYSPPKSRKGSKLMDHIVTTLHALNTTYPDSPIILGADKNETDISPILNCGLRLKQVVDLPTRRDKILDILIMNTPELYKSPIIVPPVPCDDPNAGVPSDHSVPVCIPHTNKYSRPVRRYKTISYRPLPDEGVMNFGKWITSATLDGNDNNMPNSDQALKLQNLLHDKLDEFCPLKTIKISSHDKPWINFELKKLKRQKMREWQKNGKTEKYRKLAKVFESKYKKTAENFMNKKVEALKITEPGKAFKILKTMGAKPGDSVDDLSFTLPAHQKEGLTSKQSAEKIAEYFSKISNEYPPLNIDLLPERVKSILKTPSSPPIISEYECYMKILSTKKPKSGVPGELPHSFLKEFGVELAKPLTALLNNIIINADWPDHWKIEYVTPIAKITQPEDEDDLRPISLTPFFSKVMEQFVVKWILDIIGDKLDFRQYGGTKGNSIAHYLIELINFYSL